MPIKETFFLQIAKFLWFWSGNLYITSALTTKTIILTEDPEKD